MKKPKHGNSGGYGHIKGAGKDWNCVPCQDMCPISETFITAGEQRTAYEEAAGVMIQP